MLCRLCNHETRTFWKNGEKEYFKCNNCRAVQLSPAHYISAEAEKDRYLTHNNDIADVRYQNFVNPITSRILVDFSPDSHGLDYGCGTGPVAASVLKKENYQVALYDPFFVEDHTVLNNKFNFIICCEVMEHFYQPAEEFKMLSSLLYPGGKLYCKTSLFSDNTDFEKWYYKNDPTHVFFYATKSLEWIKDTNNFSSLEVSEKLIVFTK